MRWIILLVASVLVSGCGFQKKMPPPPPPSIENFIDNSPCAFFNDYTVAARLKRMPFKSARKTELVSFEDEEEWMLDSIVFKEKRGGIPKKEAKIDRSKLSEIRVLSYVQMDSLTNIFFNYDYGRSEGGIISIAHLACYNPRHAILFYKNTMDTEPFAYFEVCLECQYVITFPKQYKLGNFCEGKYDLLRAFFRQTGIKYGLEADH